MQQSIVKQIQFSSRSFHLFIHLQYFYWTPSIDQYTEQSAGDIGHCQQWILSVEERRDAIKQPAHTWTNVLIEEHSDSHSRLGCLWLRVGDAGRLFQRKAWVLLGEREGEVTEIQGSKNERGPFGKAYAAQHSFPLGRRKWWGTRLTR